MANVNKPFGLRPVGTLGQAAYVGKVRKFYVPATDDSDIFIGDAVISGGTSGALYPGDPDYPTADIAAAGNTVLGVCVGIEPLYSDLTVNYRKASTGMYILVDTDPDTIYEIQSDATGVSAENINLNADLSVVAGDTTTGRSKSVLTGPAADATNDFLILGFAPDVDNDVSSAPYVRVHVKLNLCQYANGATGS
jgi:hypothetical protein